jgi:tetratricopeptide (TPR) repeat protein
MIRQLDPDNAELSSLDMEVLTYKNEQERIALEKAQKKAERDRQLNLLSPGKNEFLQKKWYRAQVMLEEFLRNKNIDEDLIKEATSMHEQSKENLNQIIGPLIGKARSLKEGQDLKGAYEYYLQVLAHNPTSEEALNEMNEIRTILENRSKKKYREAIISESLSLFDDAKEKFQEVQQISPTDSTYYKKATEKLKEYLE